MKISEIAQMLDDIGYDVSVNGDSLLVSDSFMDAEYEVRGDELYREGLPCIKGSNEDAVGWITDEFRYGGM